jgi:hypothetical protein
MPLKTPPALSLTLLKYLKIMIQNLDLQVQITALAKSWPLRAEMTWLYGL